MILIIQDITFETIFLEMHLCIAVANTFASHLRLKEELFWFSNVPTYHIELNNEVRNVSFANSLFAHFPSMVCEIQ